MSANIVDIRSKQSPSSFYSFAKVLSCNAVYNFVVGARGLGKTYGAKKKVINDYFRKGHQFIYLRRYKDEMRIARDTFFADVEHMWPDWDFKTNGFHALMSPVSERETRKRPWKIIGFFVSLSTSQQFKSVAFPDVHTIIYDEFIIEKGAVHYLPDEAKVFNNFYSTVDRYKDKTRVLFLANSVTISNPFFLEYRIEPTGIDQLIVKEDGFVAAHFPDSSAFANEVYQTRFGKFIEGTEYADYAVANKFLDNNGNLVDDKNNRAKYQFSLECRDGIFSVWYDMVNNKYYAQEKRPGNEIMFTMLPERMRKGVVLVNFSDRVMSILRTAFRQGMVYFDKPQTRNAFIEIFKR